MVIQTIKEFKRIYSDIKKYERVKTLKKDNKEDLNSKLLCFIINKS